MIVSIQTLRQKIDHFGYLPSFFADDCDEALKELELLREKIELLESLTGWALTVESRNTDAWMEGMRDAANKVLVADGDARRCFYEHGRLVLRNVTQCIPDGE